MQRGERFEAKKRLDRFYNTGKPCSKGHMSDRYTKSGACVECFKFTPDEPKVAVSSPRNAARVAREMFYNSGVPCGNGHMSDRYTKSGGCVECLKFTPTSDGCRVKLPVVKVRAYHNDRQQLAACALMMAVVHDSTLTDADTGKVPTNVAGGTGMYSFYCHNDDQGAFRQLAVSLIANRHIDTDKARLNALSVAAAVGGDADTTPAMNFK